MRSPEQVPGSSQAAWNFDPQTTLVRLLAANAKAFPDRVAMREKDRGIWQETTWRQVHETVTGCAAGLQALGLAAGQAVLVLGDNRPRLYMGMLAAGALRAVPMPVYPDATPEEILHALQDVDVRIVLAEDQHRLSCRKPQRLQAGGAAGYRFMDLAPGGLLPDSAVLLTHRHPVRKCLRVGGEQPDQGGLRIEVPGSLAAARQLLRRPHGHCRGRP